MSKKRTGECRRNGDGYYVGRVRGDDGKRSPWTPLNTNEERHAHALVDRWIETGLPPSQTGRELFSQAAERLLQKMRDKGDKRKKIINRAQRLRDYALPSLGDMEVGRVEPHDVARVLDAMAAQGKAKGTCNTMLADISRVFALVRRGGGVKNNPALDVGLPEEAYVETRLPIILEDYELLTFRQKRGFETELDMMVLFACDLAGHRTSDLHAACYEDCDLVHWLLITVRRPKTTDKAGRDLLERRERERPGTARRATRAYERVQHRIPHTVREPLINWWRKHGCPTSGPIFPVQRGKRAGHYKGDNISYAQAFRDALWEAGIHRPLPGFDQAVGETARRALDALQVDTDETLAVDFHSLRRWYATRMANIGLNEQTAMDLMGHTVASTHARYRGARVVGTPDHALLGAEPAPAPVEPPPPAPVAPDMATLAATVAAAVAQALAGHLQPPPPPPTSTNPAIDPSFGSMKAPVELRAIAGGKKK